MTYLLMILLSALHWTLPAPVLTLAKIVGDANAFLAMLVIGVGFQLGGERSQIAAVARILLPRYGMGIALAAISFFLLPLPLAYRQVLAVLFVGPIASAAPGFTAELKNDYGLSSAVNSLSILTSICLILLTLTLVL